LSEGRSLGEEGGSEGTISSFKSALRSSWRTWTPRRRQLVKNSPKRRDGGVIPRSYENNYTDLSKEVEILRRGKCGEVCLAKEKNPDGAVAAFQRNLEGGGGMGVRVS